MRLSLSLFILDELELNLFFFRNQLIREDTAKYPINAAVNSAHCDPKTRFTREDPLPDADPNEKFYGVTYLLNENILLCLIYFYSY